MLRASHAIRWVALMSAAAFVFVTCGDALAAQSSRRARVAQRAAQQREEAGFGPVVRAYLGYLRAQQEVVDDRESRHEIDRRYYLRNSSRIRALRQAAIRIARETGNDYLPELEAVARDEFHLLFDEPPPPESLQSGATLNYTYRYLSEVRAGGELFHVFARLDPYEQAELKKQAEASRASGAPPAQKVPHAQADAHDAPSPTTNPAPTHSTGDEKRPRRATQP